MAPTEPMERAIKEMFSAEEIRALRCIMERTWDTVASDIASSGDGGADYTRYDVAELTLDGDRWKAYGDPVDVKFIEEAGTIQKLRDLTFWSAGWKKAISIILPFEFYEA